MEYTKVVINTPYIAASDLLLAQLMNIGYEGFEETGKELVAYIPSSMFNDGQVRELVAGHGISIAIEIVPEQNWNAQWESNFQPVIVGDLCTIRAAFHDIAVTTRFEIVITPKMSFGTGHHATTQLMMLAMEGIDMGGKTVLDFGSGTGILAILAELLGAKAVTAIDIDAWPYENALENVAMNGCSNITVQQAVLSDIGTQTFDVILANINRHILLQEMELMYTMTGANGVVLMSGLLEEDADVVVPAALQAGFVFDAVTRQQNWIALQFHK